MSRFFDRFPKTLYDIGKGTGVSNYQSVTNITFRIGIIKEVLNNISSYYKYSIREGDTPEILAEKIYNNPEAHWIILYANDIYDPHTDWPMGSRAFFKYLANKYRDQAAVSLGLQANTISDQQVVSWTQDTTSANSVHHYEKQIVRTNYISPTDTAVLTINLEVDRTNLTSTINSSMDIANTAIPAQRKAWEYYTGEAGDPRALEFAVSFETFNNVAGKTVTQETKGFAVTYYDYENNLNESKRLIKIIKPEYYNQISSEFQNITGSRPSFIRRLIG